MEGFLDLLRSLGTILLALMILNVMILVHEWGHFLAARWRGLKVDKFQIWFGKPIWKKTVNGVQYGLGWLPAGGFVALPQMAPMDAIEGKAENDEPLPPIKPLDKIIVAFAGPLFSFMLAIVFAFILWPFGRPIREANPPTQIGYIDPKGPAASSDLKPGDIIRQIDGKPVSRWEGQVSSVRWGIISSESEQITFTVERDGQLVDAKVTPVRKDIAGREEATSWAGKLVGSIFGRPALRQVGIAGNSGPLKIAAVLENSPAAAAGLKVDDVLVAVNGQPITHIGHYFDVMQGNKGEPLALTYERAGQKAETTLTPRIPDEPADSKDYSIGVAFSGKEDVTTREATTPLALISESTQAMKNLITAIAAKGSDVSVGHMGGPVMIVRIYKSFLSQPDAWVWILWFSVLFNVNLAIMNMLPLPVLDGGHITMALIEWVRRKPLNIRLLEWVQSACVLLVLGFFIMVTAKDLGDVFGGKKESGEIKFHPLKEAK